MFAGWGEQLASTEVLHIPFNLYTSPAGNHCPWFSDEALRLRETKEPQDDLDRNIKAPGRPKAPLCGAVEEAGLEKGLQLVTPPLRFRPSTSTTRVAASGAGGAEAKEEIPGGGACTGAFQEL